MNPPRHGRIGRAGPGLLLSLLAAAPLSAQAPAQPSDRWVVTSETRSIDVGSPSFAWFKLDGWFGNESDDGGRTAAWIGKRARLQVFLVEPGNRTLRLQCRAAAPGIQVEVRWNGSSLGTREAPLHWGDVAWSVPASVGRRGRNVVVLEANRAVQPAGDLRYLALMVDGVDLVAPGPLLSLAPGPTTLPRLLPPGGMLVSPGVTSPASSLYVEVEGPGARLLVLADSWDGGRRQVGSLDLAADSDVSAGLLDRLDAGPALPPAAPPDSQEAPGAPLLLSPVEGQTSNLRPAFRWLGVPGATSYRIWLEREARPVIDFQPLPSHAACEGRTCSFAADEDLTEGEHAWWVQSWRGKLEGGWSEEGRFVVLGRLPGPIQALATLDAPNPTLLWTQTGTHCYELWLEGPGDRRLMRWLEPGPELRCAGGRCAYPIAEQLPAGHYAWRVRGFNSLGEGPWGEEERFYLARNRFELSLGGEFREGLTILVQGDRPAKFRAVAVAGDASLAAWRRACGLVPGETLIPLGLLLLLLLVARRRAPLPGERFAPWMDALLVLAVALAVRFTYLHFYPTVNPYRFGDGWEYLSRARRLASPGTSFLHDTTWHAWSTWIRPPGYYVFLYAILERTAGGFAGLARAQAVLSGLTCASLYLLAFPLFGRRAALVGSLLFAGYAESVLSVSWVLREPLYVCLLTGGLACLAWASTGPRTVAAAAGGLLLGAAALVRSEPAYYVPVAALLLLLGRGRAALRQAAVLAGAAALAILPWCARNSLVYGRPMGIDNSGIPAFLYVHPDDRYVRASDLDLATPQGLHSYYQRLKRADEGHRLSNTPGIVREGILRLLGEPSVLARRYVRNMADFFRGFPADYIPTYLEERQGCRVAAWTDALNRGYLVILVPGLLGMLLTLRDRRTWPVAAWPLFLIQTMAILFYPDAMAGRFRLACLPVFSAWAGAGLVWLGGLPGRRAAPRGEPRLRPKGDAKAPSPPRR